MVYLAKLFAGILGEKIGIALRSTLFNAQLNIPLDIYQKKGVGKYLLRYSGDMQSVRNFFVKGLILFLADCLFVLMATILLFKLSWQLSLVFSFVFIVFYLCLHFLNKELKDRVQNNRNRKSNLLSFVSYSLANIKSLEVFNKKPVESKKFARHSENVYSTGIAFQHIQALFTGMVQGLVYILLLSTLVAGIYMENKQVDGVVLLVTIMMIFSLLPVLRRLLSIRLIWEKGKISLEKLEKVLGLALIDNRRAIKYLGEDIVINCESSDPMVIRKGWNEFKLKQMGVRVVDKLVGLVPLEKAEIKVGEQDLRNFNPRSWRKNISVIDDRFPLIGKTVYEAVTYSRKPESRRRSQIILDHIQKFVPEEDRLDLDTFIGVQGCLLPPYQIKLLQIVRGLTTKKSILVIRDLAGGLNADLEKKIRDILSGFSKNKTVLLIDT
jgi:ABC-type multidrug transport system fused ATPase/permease subunit